MFEASHAGPAVLGVPRATLWEGALSLARLAAVGLVAIGVSAILALAMGAAWGAPFVAGDLPGVTYTAERCQDLMEYAILVSLIAIAALAGMRLVATQITAVFWGSIANAKF